MTSLDPSQALAIATDAALEAGQLLLKLRRAPPVGIRSKSSATDLVSEADDRAEQAIVARVRAARPEDAIIAEEGSNQPGGSGIRWFIDPLDGTINYLYGFPQWSVAICCVDDAGGIAGVVHDPLRDETFGASRGGGAYLGTARIHVTDRRDLATALIATGFAYDADHRRIQGQILANVVSYVRDIRRAGSASLDLAFVAAGRLDGYFESVDKPWDWMAGALLVREAGGRVTELRHAHPAWPNIVASGPDIHDDLIALLDRAVDRL